MKRPWSDFAHVRSTSFVRDLVADARDVPPADLVEIEHYRKEERLAKCGCDPLSALVAYGQETLVYKASSPRRGEAGRGALGERSLDKSPPPNLPPTGGGDLIFADAATYAATPRARRLNVFGLAYRRDAKL